jgi:hypothetical protein
MNGSAIWRLCLVVALLALAGGCGSSDKTDDTSTGGVSTGGASTTTGGTSSGGATTTSGGAGPTGGVSSTGGSSATGGASTSGGAGASGGATSSGGASTTGGASTAGGAGGAGVGGATGTGGSGGGVPNSPFVYFVKQTNGTTTATLAGGVITVSSKYSSSGNAFKYVAPNYYGTDSNGFIVLSTTMSGDFSIAAEVTITAQNKSNNACGIGLGMTTGFTATDSYAYTLMRNSNNSTSGAYVSAADKVSTGAPEVAFTDGTPLELSFTRSSAGVTLGAGPVGGTLTTQALAATALTDGTTAYGAGPVYPAISFNNVEATITKLLIKDAAGTTVYDSASGSLVTYIPASLTLSAPAVSIKKGASASLTATAVAMGGTVAEVTAVAADPAIVDVKVTQEAAGSTIALTGLAGGVTELTVTNTSDTNPKTNTKTVTVSVNDYSPSDDYGDLATVAYPAPNATDAYIDGELALTFDSPPTLNPGGSIQIFSVADGAQVDSIAFSGETLVMGDTAIKVGSQLVRVGENTVYIIPHHGKLAYDTAYYVAIPTTSITGTLNGVPCVGLSDSNGVATWNFTTRSAPALDAANVTVDGSQTSTADFRTVQGALGAVATELGTAPTVTVNVAAGTYNELLRYSGTAGAAQTITLAGPEGNSQGDTCVIQWANGNGMNGSTSTRAGFYFTGANLVLENITLRNTAKRSEVTQAETLYFAKDPSGTTLAAYNSSFFGNQDTIQTSGVNWFYKCHIEGNVDFIWGTAQAALFEDCDMRMVNDTGADASYSLVVARTGSTIAEGASGTVGKGYVLLDSTVSVDAQVTAYFGRDAGTGAYYDQVALVNVTFTGEGSIGEGLWKMDTAPLGLGDGSYVGWKSAGCTGLNVASLTTAAGTSATVAEQATEYDTRDHILNRVVTVTAGTPSGYEAVATPWDVTALATAWGAP